MATQKIEEKSTGNSQCKIKIVLKYSYHAYFQYICDNYLPFQLR
jgi:hypothetical protein